MANEFDHEVVELVRLLNTNSEISSQIVHCTDSFLKKSQAIFKPLFGGIDWGKAALVSSTEPKPEESSVEQLARILGEFDSFVRIFNLEAGDIAIIVSDDFYSIGIQCRTIDIRQVLKKWIGLPHGILVFDENFQKCFHVSFVGSTYMGQAKERDRQSD